MDYERLWTISNVAMSGKRLTEQDVRFLQDKVPAEFGDFPDIERPTTIRHPAGFSVSGASVGTFLSSALLLGGQKVFGRRYEGSAFYQRVEKDLAFRIMHSHFHRGLPKGTHCCAPCTLAVYPVLKARGIKYFDCSALAKDVGNIIRNREWRFAAFPNQKMIDWAMSDGAG